MDSKESNSIKTWIIEERPREMLFQKGAESLSLSKLLAIILRTGGEGMSAEELSRRLLNRFLSLRAIDERHASEICKIKGIGPAKAAQVKAAFELGKRLCKEIALNRESITSPDEAIQYVASYYGPYLQDAGKEFFCITLLNKKNKPIKNIELSKGGLSDVLLEPREVIREALIHNCSSIILVHNHPSGDGEPSAEDIQITRRIGDAGGIFKIGLLDHIIIGKNKEDYFSFRKAGLIQAD